MQMFVPGFTAKQLPITLSNINNVRYRQDGKLIALGHNGGNVYVLSDTDGDGLEITQKSFGKAMVTPGTDWHGAYTAEPPGPARRVFRQLSGAAVFGGR